MKLKSGTELERSPTVANSCMNRERGLLGPNSYWKDLQFDLFSWLMTRATTRGEASWLDLCCGTGRALVEAATRLESEPEVRRRIEFLGVDLVASHDRRPVAIQGLEIVEANLDSWEPGQAFDLVTCVHGLHYVGDKLGLIERALTWIEPGGVFLANLDPANLRWSDGRPAGRWAARAFRSAGLGWDARAKILRSDGPRALQLGVEFVGANDDAGPNCTGQRAVDSHYRRPVRNRRAS